MKKQVYRRLSLLSLVVALPVLTLSSVANAQGPTQISSMDFFLQVRATMCDVMNPSVGMITGATPNDALLFNARGCGPVLSTDGHQLTLGEFKAVQGTASVKCSENGTHTVVHYSGLVPKGTYTVWLVIFDNGPRPTPFTTLSALGNSDPSDPIINNFTASESGEGQLSLTNSEGVGSGNGGPIPPCWLDHPWVEVHLVYHIDGQTYGATPGPLSTWVVPEIFQFINP
jgi:hypothetical protein